MQADRAYLAATGFGQELHEELIRAGKNITDIRGELMFTQGEKEQAVPANAARLGNDVPLWAQNVWYAPQVLPFTSIKDAARQLKNIQRNWAHCATATIAGDAKLSGRAKLIQEQLPYVSAKPLVFGNAMPTAPLGSWCLLDANTLCASTVCSSPVVDGAVRFVEDKDTPPTRAYLKLWEIFTRMGVRPAAGELCLDLGSCPGGWTWVLASCGANVFSIDKSPLAPHIDRMPQVNFCTGSAFAFDPRHAGRIDWLCCDVICYPERLLATVARWLELGDVRNFVCTIKLQNATDYETVEQFAAIPHSHIVHLSCNKHEFTWVRLAPELEAQQTLW